MISKEPRTCTARSIRDRSPWRALSCSLLVSLVVSGCNGDTERQQLTKYTGPLKPEILSGGAGPTSALEHVSEDAIASLDSLIPDGATVQVAVIDWHKGAAIPVYLVTTSTGDRFVLADGDRTGNLEESEKSVLVAAPEDPARYDATVSLTLEDHPVTNYNLTVSLFDFSGFEIPDGRSMPKPRLMAGRAQVEGIVDVNGHSIMVKVPYSFKSRGIGAGSQALDANYDGKYDTSFTTRELAYAAEDRPQPIFRINDTYVSVEAVDVENWLVTLVEHPAEDYRRIELEVGNRFPDFEYRDLGGNTHTLSELVGKYVLLNVWGTWCRGCLEELPHLKKIYAGYRDQGLVILSLNNERSNTEAEYGEALERVREFVAKNEIDWPQSSEASVRELIDERLLIRAYPTSILLDPNGKIVSVPDRDGDWRRHNEKLGGTLEALIGAD